MATILIKKRDTTGAPGAGDLTNSSGGAELAVNTFDKKLYAKDSGGNVVVVGAPGDVAGPASSTGDNIALFDGTTGKLLKDGGKGVPSGAIVGTSDSQALTNKTISGASNTLTVDGTNSVGYLKVPQSGSDKTTSYTLATSDIGEFVGIGTGGSITIPNSTFSAGDVISLFNNTSGNITITCSITTCYLAGTNEDKATLTLATRGIATVLFISGTVAVVSGNVS